jgi:hypothetical protein
LVSRWIIATRSVSDMLRNCCSISLVVMAIAGK